MNALRIADIELAYADRGQGLLLLLVHGFPLDHAMWEAQIAGLSDRCRVLAPDLRGFGRSGATPGTVTMEQLADDLAALVDVVVKGPVVLAGLSMGGYVAWEFWRRHTARLRGLILCDTRAAADTPEAAAARRETAAQVEREGPAALADAMLPRLLAPAAVENDPHLGESLRQMILRQNPAGVAAAARGMAQRRDFTALLPQIVCPTLLVVGSHDVISTPQEMGTMARAIPGARLVEIAAAGHMSPLEQPAAFNQAVREFIAAL